MSILITGANGFVGSYLAKALSYNYSLSLATRRPVSTPFDSRSILMNTINIDTDWTSALMGCSVVIHLAGRAHILKEISTNPLADFRKINVDGSLALARQAIAARVKRFIFVSSIGVNGYRTNEHPFTESSRPCPSTEYALSKFEAEEELKKLVLSSDMELVIIRPPLVYAGNAPGNFQKLLRLVQSGLPLPFASITNQRSLVSLDNLIDFISVCIEHPKAPNETFLISDGNAISTPDLIRNIAVGLNKTPKLFSCPVNLIKGAAKIFGKQVVYSQLCESLIVDSRKAQNLLGWRPIITSATALQAAGRDFINQSSS